MPVYANDPVDFRRDIGCDVAQDTGDLGDLSATIGGQRGGPRGEQHLGREDETVPLDAHTLLIAQKRAQAAKELGPVLFEVLRLGLQPRTFSRFKLGAAAFFGGDPCEGGVQI